MEIAIAGMHRSGTSMVASLLRQAGLYLGRDEEMLPPAADNPGGFWEHAEFVTLNDEVLRRAGRHGQSSRSDDVRQQGVTCSARSPRSSPGSTDTSIGVGRTRARASLFRSGSRCCRTSE